MSEVAAAENNVPVVDVQKDQEVQDNEIRARKKPTGKRSNAVDVMSAEAELITKGLTSEDIDGKRTTRSSTRVSTVASKLKKSEPPAKKVKKTPGGGGGKRGRPKAAAKDEGDEVDLAENGISENNVDSKIDQGGSSTEDEVDAKVEQKIENGNSSAEEEKDVKENKESAKEPEKPIVTEEKDSSNQ